MSRGVRVKNLNDALKVLPTYFLGHAKITAGAPLYTSWLFPLSPLYFFRVSKITAGALLYTYWIFRYENTTHVLSSPRQDYRWSSAAYLLALLHTYFAALAIVTPPTNTL